MEVGVIEGGNYLYIYRHCFINIYLSCTAKYVEQRVNSLRDIYYDA